MNNEKNHAVKYAAAVLYYEQPKEGVLQIHVRFPDLLSVGLSAFTVGNSREDAIAAAEDLLADLQEFAAEDGITFPNPTPLEKLSIDRGHNGQPFKIELVNIPLENE